MFGNIPITVTINIIYIVIIRIVIITIIVIIDMQLESFNDSMIFDLSKWCMSFE